MKIQITLTKAEKEETLDIVTFDPCAAIHCRKIDCDECPLQCVAEDVRRAGVAFANVLDKIAVEDDE